jgi:hypothetical protein
MTRRTVEPRGHSHRMSRAKDATDEPLLLPADLAWLMSCSVTAICARDEVIRHVELIGPTGMKSRRYALADVRAFIKQSTVGRALAAVES